MFKWTFPFSVLACCAASCPAVDPPLAVLLPHERHCSEFYLCSNGRPILMSCARGTEFNAALRVCDWPQNAGCQAQTSQAPTVPSKPTETTTVLTTRDPIGSPIHNLTSETIANTKEPTEATISTSGPTESPMSQWPTALTNSTLQQTDSPILTTESMDWTNSISEQTNSSISTTGSTDSSSTNSTLRPTDSPISTTKSIDLTNSTSGQTNSSISTTGYTDSTDLIPGSSSDPTTTASIHDAPECPPTDLERYLLPNPHNCSTFFSCSNGVLFQMECPDDLYFNADLMVCDWPENAGCNNSGNHNQDDNNEPGHSTTALDLSTTESTSQPTINNASTESENSTREPVTETDMNTTVTENDSTTELQTDPSVLGCPTTDPERFLLPDLKNCSKFYSCSNGIPILMDCPDGLYFDPDSMVCDWSEQSGCNRSENGNHESTTEMEHTGESDVHTKAPTTELEDSSERLTTEPSDSTKEPTTHAEIATEIVSGCQPDNPELYLLPKPSNCSQFYSCSNGVAVTKECPDGLYFNPNNLVCDWRENVDCPSEVTTEIAQTSTINNNSDTNESTTEPQETNTEVNESTTKVANKTSTDLDESLTILN